MKKIWITIFLLLCGCSGTPQAIPANTVLPITQTPEVLLAPAASSTPGRKTASLPTPVPTGTPTSVQMPETEMPQTTQIDPVVIELLDEPFDTGKLSGTLVLMGQSPEDVGDIYLVDLADGEKIPLDRGGFYCSGVSPDRSKLLCQTNDQLQILNSTGQVEKEVANKDHWYLIAGWLNDGEIIIVKRPDPIDPDKGYVDLMHTLVYDPSTDEELDFPPDYPGINNIERFGNVGIFSVLVTIYAPNLGYVVFQNLDWGYTIWDRWDEKMIVDGIPIGHAQPYPQWSPDGSQVILAGASIEYTTDRLASKGMEIYLVDTSGEVTQVTNFTPDLSDPYLFDLSWSPDGQQFAFSLFQKETICENVCVLVYDVKTQQLRTYRLADEYMIDPNMDPEYHYTWSPDGNYLLLSASVRGDYKNQFILVFDILHGSAQIIEDHMRILGWMKSR